jgi:hypothetical protein
MKKKIYLEGTSIKVLYPDINFFLNKIRANEPFKYLKVMHGTFDGIAAAYNGRMGELENLIVSEDYETIGNEVALGKNSRLQSGLDFWHDKDPNLPPKYTNAVKILHQYKNLSNDIMIGISLGVGLGTFWGVHDHSHPIQVARRKIAGILDNNTYHTYLYGGVFKHFTIKDESYYLFDVLNQLGYNVGFFGPKYFSRYKDVFNIKNFTHLEIPVKGAIQNLDNEIERIREFGKNSDTPTIVFLQCGHMMASNIIYELKDENITIIDIGRSFDLLLKDEVNQHDTMWRCWTGLNPNGLEKYVDKTRE